MSETDNTSTQQRSTLRDSTSRPIRELPRRPLLRHLNADTSWLLSIPYPPAEQSSKGSTFFHILIDPWLRGPQSDVAKFFSQQWHSDPSAVQTIAEVDKIIQIIESGDGEDTAIVSGPPKERSADDTEDGRSRGQKGPSANGSGIWSWVGHKQRAATRKESLSGTNIDCVVISHEFTDHMHRETLLEISPAVPIFATSKAASIIRSWKHFHIVHTIQRFDGDWRHSSSPPLPNWVGVSRVAYAGTDLLYYHSAIMLTFPHAGGREDEAEAVIYTPHGTSPSDLAPVSTADPKIRALALLHGLHDIRLPQAQLNMGAHNGLRVQRLLGAKYWVGTHDEVKRGAGIVSWVLDRRVLSLKDAMEREVRECVQSGEEMGKDAVAMADVRFDEVGNGVSLVLA